MGDMDIYTQHFFPQMSFFFFDQKRIDFLEAKVCVSLSKNQRQVL